MSEEAKKEAKKPAAKKAAAKADDKVEAKADAKAEKKPAKRASAKKADDKADAKSEKKAEPRKAAAKKADAKREKKTDTGVKKQGKLIDDTRLYNAIVKPIITEKSTIAAEQSKVVFEISPTATKPQVKSAIEALFGVKVEKVNTIKTKGKVKRFRGRTGQRSDMRKAIVTLKEGQNIDIAAGLK